MIIVLALVSLAASCAFAEAARSADGKPPMVLLIARFSHPSKSLVATTLGWMCKDRGWEFDAYYAAEREGGIFANHGSTALGGRHYAAVARALAGFDTTVVRLGDVDIFTSLINPGARQVMADEKGLIDLYERTARRLGMEFPKTAVAVQTRDLPKGLQHGVGQYVFPESVYRKAVAVPLELKAEEVQRLKSLGVAQVWTVAAKGADTSAWRAAGMDVQPADDLSGDYLALTVRVAERWLKQAAAVDACEPILAEYLLPMEVRDNRLQLCAPAMKAAVDRIPALAKDKGQAAVYGRYGGGAIGGIGGDKGLFGLFRAGISFQVTEPGRPPLTVFAHRPAPMPQPAKSWTDLEPSDEQLAKWAAEGKILATYITHSGELSHEDALAFFVDYTATTKVRFGMGVHWQRYAMDPDCVEPMQVPVDEGGVLGLVEPVLHSGGFGIIAESLAPPDKVAGMMREAREAIAKISGERFAPRGVYCYLDATPEKWQDRQEGLWKAVADAGFEYLVSSVAIGPNRVLYRQGNFIVINQCGGNQWPSSPFARVKSIAEMEKAEQPMADAKKPGWLAAVLDSPLYGYPPYLSTGHKWGGGVRIGELYDYIHRGGKSGRVVSATPRTIARYARLLDDKGLLEK
jgi:hypothetical protein